MTVPSRYIQIASTPSRESMSARPSSYVIQKSAVDKASPSALSPVMIVTDAKYSAGCRVSGSMIW